VLQILPPEQVYEILADYQCHSCLRSLSNHTEKEGQTCHDHLRSIVTVTHQVKRQNTLHHNDEQKLGRPT